MSCEKCDSARRDLRVHALQLAVEASSISHKIDFEALADRYFAWLSMPPGKPQKKNVKSS
jgi:hypothetical protein